MVQHNTNRRIIKSYEKHMDIYLFIEYFVYIIILSLDLYKIEYFTIYQRKWEYHFYWKLF